jgi:GTPase SAR1 family protein
MFECRDMRDDKDYETVNIRKDAYTRSSGCVLCYDPYDVDSFTELEKYFVPEIRKVKQNNNKIDAVGPVFVLLAIDWKPSDAKPKQRPQDPIAPFVIAEFAKKLGKYVAVVQVPTPNNKQSLDWTLDKVVRIIYQASGAYETPALEKSFLSSVSVQQVEEKNGSGKDKKCILS